MFSETLVLPELIDTRAGLDALVRTLSVQSRLAVDTESNSLHAYRERVCLIQFSTTSADYIIDPLALEDVHALGDVFANPAIEKIFHAAEYDILCLRRDFGFAFANLFDTMQAGRILGSKMAGLDRLLADRFGLRVSKRFQKADWGVRPLSRELLEYAARDTHYLIPLRDMLADDLLQKGLLELAREDFRLLANHRHPAETIESDSPAWTHFAARRDLGPETLAILNELLQWRESTAERLDRPPFKVLSDERLIDIAKNRPTTLGDLADLGIPERPLKGWGLDLIKAVARGADQPPLRPPRRRPPSATYLKRLDLLKDWRKREAARMEVESDVILPRSLLLALAEGGVGRLNAVMQASPWRLRHFGPQISKILSQQPDSQQ